MRRLRPFRTLGSRLDAWVIRRVRRSPGPITVQRNRVYILPTRFGYGFGLLCLIMLLGAMNYSNSMGFALCFLLAGLGLVCMHHTHANLVGVHVRGGHVPPVFAGDTAAVEILLEQPGRQPRLGLSLGWPRQPESDRGDVPAAGAGAARLTLRLETPRRGWQAVPIFSLWTEFPLGLFRAWTFAELDLAVLVYPHPAEGMVPPPPQARADSRGERQAQHSGQDRFAGLRGYQRGDALNRVHWKSLPKSQTPMVKQFEDPRSPECWLELDLVPGTDLEQRLSLLARWVLDLDTAGQRYGLRLPGQRIDLGHGDGQRHACLKALALYGLPE